jgi:hypothetical protein
MLHFVYFLERADGDIKIGKSSVYGFQSRLRDITKHHGPLKALGGVEGSFEHERALHKQFAAHRRTGKNRWNKVEWFAPADELLQFIAANSVPLPRLPSPIERTYKLVNE